MTAVRSWAGIVTVMLLCQGRALAGAPGRLAEAQDSAAKVIQLNREALAAIDKREFEKAREILKKALELCQSAGLLQRPVAARTHVHMGVVIIEGFKNRELGERQFIEALTIEPTIAMTPALVTPEITEAFQEARDNARDNARDEGQAEPIAEPKDEPKDQSTIGAEASARAAAPAAPPGDRPTRDPAAPAAAAAGGGFTYHMVSEVKQGNAIRVTVNVDENLKFHKVVLAYRPPGTSEFLGREMDPVGPGAYSAEIPDRATTGSSVAYYIEAQDDDGQPVASRGTEERPLVIQLGGQLGGGEASHPAEHARVVETPRENDGDESTTVRAQAENDEENLPTWFASLQLGSGVGYTAGTAELNLNVPVSGTFASTSLGHVAPELGYWITSDLMISAQGRIQVVTGPTEIDIGGHLYSPEDLALALFVKASLFFGSGSFRPFLSGGLGGGQIRHVVKLGAYNDCGPTMNQVCVDSVVAGPALAEVGGGLLYQLTAAVGFEAGTNVEVAEPKFTLNFDFNAGLAFGF